MYAIEKQALISSENQTYRLDNVLHILEDPSGQYTISQILSSDIQRRFSPGNGQVFNGGYTRSVYWLKFQTVTPYLQDDTSNTWVLEIPFPLLDYVDLYEISDSGAPQIYKSGDQLPFEQRFLQSTNLSFPITLKSGETQEFYLRVQTRDSMQVPLILSSLPEFTERNEIRVLIQGIYYGFMLVMILYNLFVFLSVRDKTYLYYILYISTFALFQAGLNGFTYEYFWPNDPQWANRNIPFLDILAIVFAVQFSRSILHTKNNTPRLDKLLQALFYIGLAILPVNLWGHYDLSIFLTLLYSFIFFNVILVTGFISLSAGVRSARYFLTAWFVFLTGGSLYVLMIIDILPINFLTSHAFQFGSAMEVVLLSLALADRINTIQREKAEIERRTKLYLEQANQELERSNKIKDEFLATISHEIRTPMNGVLGMAELMSDTKLDPRQNNYLDSINNSAQALLSILNDVLDYSKIEAGKMEIESIRFDVASLIDECVSIFSAQSHDSHVELLAYIDSNVDTELVGDPTRIRQIIINLLSNAFKFTHQGKIHLRVSLNQQYDQRQLTFEVQDSGIGIAEEHQHRLFESFSQADASTTRKYGGTGLGLAICKRLTKLMGGEISVTSALGKGSNFRFTCNVERITNPLRHANYQDKKRALLALDSDNKIQSLKQQLNQWGIKSTSCVPAELSLHGEQALTNNYDLLVADSFCQVDNKPIIEWFTENNSISTNGIIVVGSDIAIDDSLAFCSQIQDPIYITQLYDAIVKHLDGPSLLDTQTTHTPIQLNYDKLNVMVVEDNKVNQLVVKGLLNKLGIEPYVANNGLEAVEAYQNKKFEPNVILMDCEMPTMDGYEATEKIRALNEGSDSPIIVALSAHIINAKKAQAKSAGMDNYLAKPVSIQDLDRLFFNYREQLGI